MAKNIHRVLCRGIIQQGMRPTVENREVFSIKRIARFNSSVLKDAAISICVALISGKDIDFTKWITRNIRELE